jgi:hypothetical protein
VLVDARSTAHIDNTLEALRIPFDDGGSAELTG